MLSRFAAAFVVARKKIGAGAKFGIRGHRYLKAITRPEVNQILFSFEIGSCKRTSKGLSIAKMKSIFCSPQLKEMDCNQYHSPCHSRLGAICQNPRVKWESNSHSDSPMSDWKSNPTRTTSSECRLPLGLESKGVSTRF